MISVIVPVYNVEKYLRDCIDSIINQKYQEIEIILVDDGSTDNSGNICDELEKEDSRIKVIHKVNEGLGLARNSGLKVAKGEYVVFIDSDDIVEETLVQDLYDGIIENQVDTCIAGYKRVDEEGKILSEKILEFEKFYGKEVLRGILPRLIGSSVEKSDVIRMSVWNAIYSMKIIKENQILFPSEREFISEDIIFDLEYYQYATGVAILTNTNYHYRLNSTSLTKSYRKDRFEACKKLYQKELEKIRELNIQDFAKERLDLQFYIYVRHCMKQEISKFNFGKAIVNIKKICEDQMLQEITQNYPTKEMRFSQKVFLYLIRYKFSILLYFLIIFYYYGKG